MVPLFFRQCSHAIYELQCLGEVGKFVLACDVVLVDHIPLRHNLVQVLEIFSLERRRSSAAGNAFLVGELFGHEKSPEMMISESRYHHFSQTNAAESKHVETSGLASASLKIHSRPEALGQTGK
jgi:hypothetical protein